jgi:hypothetical protein
MATTSAQYTNWTFDCSNVSMAGRDLNIWNVNYGTGMSWVSMLFIDDKRSRNPSSSVERPAEHSRAAQATINDVPFDFIAIHFIGRDKELNHIDGILRSGSHGRFPNRCAIHGMHSIGKTQLALQYAKLAFGQGRFSHTFWIQATTAEKLNSGPSNILGLIGHIDRDHQDQNVKLRSARLWLESPDRDEVDWLIVFDNVEKEALGFLWMHLPRQNVRGNILFTTRT